MSKETIWIVDDDRSIRWVLEKAFKGADMEVRTFDEADSVLRALNRNEPDVIISDIRMPGMDGLEAIRHFHQEIDVPVIFVTARRRELDTILGLEMGADD